MTRLETNRAIVAILSELVESQPDSRLSQILRNHGFVKPHPNYDGVNLAEFYLESEELLREYKRMLKILKHPNPKLKLQSKDVVKVTNELMAFSGLLLSTMVMNGGIGLAAVQCDRLINLIVVDTKQVDKVNGHTLVIFNPKLIAHSDITAKTLEGCLSLEEQVEVERPISITIEYLNIMNQVIKKDFTGITARCILHEMDHLVGITLLDHKI